MSKDFDKTIVAASTVIGVRRWTQRSVCGKPHRTFKSADRGKRAAIAWGWIDVEIEPRCNGEYYVVTGYNWCREAPINKNGVSFPIQGRYRWPDK